MKVAAVQLRSGRDVAANVVAMEGLVRAAAAAGATYVLTPEMTNILERDRDRLAASITVEAEDVTLAAAARLARDLAIHVHLGSIAVRHESGGVANRSLVVGPTGDVVARYDKIHMFDVDLANGESWRESRTYRPGDRAVTAPVDEARLGLSICYDLRFPHLYRSLAAAGANLLAVPSAFTRQTGEAHWHILLRARAIENGAFVVAAAQGGRHEDGRETFGHSLIVSPWGAVLAEAADDPGFVVADIDLTESATARQRIPSLANDRDFRAPDGARPAPRVAAE